MEEVSLSIKSIKPLGFCWFFRFDGDQVVCTTFLCTVDNYEIDITQNPANGNITEYKWVTKDEFLRDEYTVMHESLKTIFEMI